MRQRRTNRRSDLRAGAAIAAFAFLWAGAAHAQRVDENAVRSAQDAFGSSIGNERIGLYNDGDARGFSPTAAGNIRLEGVYVDNPIGFSGRLVSGSSLRVGITAQGYPFPAPTGIADYTLRRVGETGVVSVSAQAGPFSTRAITIDTQQPLSDGRLGFAGGVTYRADEQIANNPDVYYGAGGVLHWSPSDRLLVQSFAGVFDYPSLRSTPLVFTDGRSEPPAPPARNLAPDWVHNSAFRPLYGALLAWRATDAWTVRAGIFRIENDNPRQRTLLLRNVRPDGAADRLLSAAENQVFGSTSGEVRATWTGDEGPRGHALHLSARARAAERAYGGSVLQALGRGSLYEDAADLPEPAIRFGPQSRDDVRQTTLGLAYNGAWAGRGELRLGVQKADYRKTTKAPGRPQVVSADSPWLYDAALALQLSERLSAYAGYTVGLEESPVAPENAVNRNEAPPALRTTQKDAGLRWKAPLGMTLVAGVFDVQKPYFNLDPSQVYRELGEVRHRGLELSLAGSPAKGLTLIVGAVLLDAEVSGELVDLKQIGPRPVGRTERQLRLNADWQPAIVPNLSLDLALLSVGDRAAGAAPQASLGGRQFTVDGRTTLDLGARWRFRVGDGRAVARLLVQNVTDDRGWEVAGSGAFVLPSPRRVSVAVTADF